ncbi:hypothetical protein KCU65_g3612, partial [Aureobasidium melanogenum]
MAKKKTSATCARTPKHYDMTKNTKLGPGEGPLARYFTMVSPQTDQPAPSSSEQPTKKPRLVCEEEFFRCQSYVEVFTRPAHASTDSPEASTLPATTAPSSPAVYAFGYVDLSDDSSSDASQLIVPSSFVLHDLSEEEDTSGHGSEGEAVQDVSMCLDSHLSKAWVSSDDDLSDNDVDGIPETAMNSSDDAADEASGYRDAQCHQESK